MNYWLIAAIAALLLVLLATRRKSFRWPALGLAGLLAAAGLYLALGNSTPLEAQPLPARTPPTQGQPMAEAQVPMHEGSHDVGAMIGMLEARLKQNPQDSEGWFVLGRSYLAQERLAEAETAHAKAAALEPRNAKMLSHHAEVLAMKEGRIDGRPLEMIGQALELNYADEKSLELAGLAAFQRQEWAQAVHFWKRLLKDLPPGTAFHADIDKAVKLAENRAATASGLGEKAKLAMPERKANPH